MRKSLLRQSLRSVYRKKYRVTTDSNHSKPIAQNLLGRRFVSWYNGEHRHSAIRFVTPDERHCGREHDILARRHQLYQLTRASNPERWSRTTRNWTPIGLVVLNPPRAEMQAAA